MFLVVTVMNLKINPWAPGPSCPVEPLSPEGICLPVGPSIPQLLLLPHNPEPMAFKPRKMKIDHCKYKEKKRLKSVFPLLGVNIRLGKGNIGCCLISRYSCGFLLELFFFFFF